VIATVGAACVGAATLLATRLAYASPSARLVYSRTPEASTCPAEAALREAVAARLGYDPFFAWAKRTIVVQVWRDGRKFLARLQLVDTDGVAHGTRTLASGESCTELFDAAALAISIAIDSLPRTEPQADGEPEPPAALATDAPAPGAGAGAGEAPAPTSAAPPTPSVAPDPAPTLAARFLLGLDVLGVFDAEPAPTGALVGLAGFDSRAASLSLELRGDAPSSRGSAAGPGHVRAWSYQATLAPCARYVSASFCVLGAVGLLYARGEGITDPRSDDAVFVTVGARVQGDWPLSAAFSLRAHADGTFDLRRASLQIGGADAWTAPLFAVAAGVGVVAHFN
jgi:hypothetical protein